MLSWLRRYSTLYDERTDAEYALLGQGEGPAGLRETFRRDVSGSMSPTRSIRTIQLAGRHRCLTLALISGLACVAYALVDTHGTARPYISPSMPADYQYRPSETPFPDMDTHGISVEEHNQAILRRLDRCRDLGMLQNTSQPIPPHLRLNETEEARYQLEGCGTNETTVMLVEDYFWKYAYQGEKTGESMWAMSTMRALKAYNYPYILTSHGLEWHDVTATKEVWYTYKDNIRLVIMHQTGVKTCVEEDAECVQSEANPAGIPKWKMLAWYWWDDVQHPLGGRFTLSPSKFNSNRFLPYTIEPECLQLPFVPASARREQLWILSKEIRYFSAADYDFAWTLDGMADIARRQGVEFVAGLKGEDRDNLYEQVEEAGIRNLGRLDQAGFYAALSVSKALVGISYPKLSPSPWEALCMGVPFINPITAWDDRDIWDQSRWVLQQGRMADLGPPYMYPVHAHDMRALDAAIQQAMAHPIERYIPKYMRFDHVLEKVAELVDFDWEEEGRIALAELKRST